MSAVALAPVGELARQLSNLVALGYPALLGLEPAEFVRRLAPLEAAAVALAPSGAEDRIPFVLVVRGVPRERAVAAVRFGPKQGFTTMAADDLARFEDHMQTFSSRPEVRQALDGYMDLVEGGHREIYRIL